VKHIKINKIILWSLSFALIFSVNMALAKDQPESSPFGVIWSAIEDLQNRVSPLEEKPEWDEERIAKIEARLDALECVPQEEVCDGLDNNCDGSIDENLGCNFCGDGVKQNPNDLGTGGPNNDGDEQCDGQQGVTIGFQCTENCILEEVECILDQTRVCSTDQFGMCEIGLQLCISDEANGTLWADCIPDEVAIPEVCFNGLDNDCDGLVDQDDPDCQL